MKPKKQKQKVRELTEKEIEEYINLGIYISTICSNIGNGFFTLEICDGLLRYVPIEEDNFKSNKEIGYIG